MSDKFDKYPIIEILNQWEYITSPIEPLEEGNFYSSKTTMIMVVDILEPFQSLLAARQRDEEMIRGLVAIMERLLCDLEMRDDFNEIYQQVEKAELRLKEGV